MPAPWVEALLESLRSSRVGSGLVGAGIGAGAGALLNDQDPTTAAIGGGVMGGAMGLMMGGRPNIRQLLPEDSILSADIAARFGRPGISPESELSRGQELHANMVDTRSPWYFNSPEIEQQASNIVHGGMSEAKLQQDDMAMHLDPIRKAGLLGELQDYLGTSTVPRLWDTVTRNQQRAYQEMAAARGAGNWDAHAAAKQAYDELTSRINDRTIAPYGLDMQGYHDQLAAQQARLSPEHYSMIQDVAGKFHDKFDELLDAAHQRGEIDDRFYQDVLDQRQRGIRYFPALRDTRKMGLAGEVYNKTPEGELFGQAGDLLDYGQSRGLSIPSKDDLMKSVEGSTAPLKNPLEQAFWMMQEMVRRSKRNDAMKTFINGAFAQADPRNDGSAFIRELLPHENLQEGVEGALHMIDNGEIRRFAAPIQWTDLLNVADARSVGAGMHIMGKAMRINSMLLTGMNTAFIARNVPRDLWDAAMLFRQNPSDMLRFANYWLKAFNEVVRGDVQDPLARQAYQEGAAGTTISRQLSLQPSWQRAAGAPETAWGTLANRLQNFTGATEDATKIAAYKVGLDRGMSPVEAAFRSRRYAGSPDFQRQGMMTSQLRPWVQFWNPQIQGIARNIERAKEDPRYMAQWMGLLAAGGLGLDTYNRQFVNPQTGRPWIEDVPEYDRQNNLIIVDPTGGVQTFSNGVQRPMMLKIPLGHVARIFMAPVLALSQHLHGDPGTPSLAQTGSNMLSQMLPLAGNIDVKHPIRSTALNVAATLNPLIRVPVEQLANRSAYTDTPIVGQRLAGLDAARQFTEDTSPVARKIGGLLGASPQRIEHILRNAIPGVGGQALAALDLTSRQERPGLEWAQKIPFAGGVLSGLTEGSVSADRQRLSENLYDTYSRSEQATRSLNDMVERQDPGTAGYAQQNAKLMGTGSGMREVVGMLSELSQAREQILRNPNLSAHERTTRLQQIESFRMQVLRGTAPMIDIANSH